MSRQLPLFLVFMLIFLFMGFYLHGSVNSQPVRDDVPVWPYPKIYQDTSNGVTLLLDPNRFNYVLTSQSGTLLDISKYPVLQQATERYQKIIFTHEIHPRINTTGTRAFTVTITLRNGSEQPFIPPPLQSAQDMKEEYVLRVSADYKGYIEANSQWGVLRALESLSQLVNFDYDYDNFHINRVPITIDDSPRFIWRGLMIDTARHFLPMETIKTIIDGMSYDKFNVLHIHLIDAQTIPIVVNKYPLLGEKARWHKKLFYTHDDLREIVQYCFMRGIVVIPEFDLPGHAHSWGNAYPEARSTCNQFKPPINVNNFPVQPANNITFDIITEMISDMSKIFSNNYMHLGGDELVLGCWQNDETVKNFLKNVRPDIKTMYDLWGYFQVALEQIYRRNNKKLICWQELLMNLKTDFYKVPKDSIIQVWELIAHLKPVVEDYGYNAVLSAGFYLDKEKPDPSMRDRHLWIDTWEDMYLVEPLRNISEIARSRVLGIEACQWGEQVDESMITVRIWARASGVAERAWSPAEVNDTTKARTRLINHRCNVFAKRGIRTTPIRPDFCPYVQLANKF